VPVLVPVPHWLDRTLEAMMSDRLAIHQPVFLMVRLVVDQYCLAHEPLGFSTLSSEA
jgi:hypothetical protein